VEDSWIILRRSARAIALWIVSGGSAIAIAGLLCRRSAIAIAGQLIDEHSATVLDNGIVM
jgi:hypothetical protein